MMRRTLADVPAQAWRRAGCTGLLEAAGPRPMPTHRRMLCISYNTGWRRATVACCLTAPCFHTGPHRRYASGTAGVA
jgi:hypothetical protein